MRVRAVPEKGKANKAVENLLARYFGVAKSSLSVVKGATDRVKTIRMENGAHLIDALRALEADKNGDTD